MPGDDMLFIFGQERSRHMSSKHNKVEKVALTGGLSNRQKQHSKAMPLATKRARAARSHQEKKSGKGKVVSSLGEG
ncbi:hypothetical protein HPP92_026942 [Vanilla planifolia]|uniref:Uncharacterized protein n=1 Tax=Vanilla planifolia TaxID=51239 RepID=A0A835PCN8_VANPL|nr:hypothetical protein HPP92_026942 [Vanilla planifolia]